ncbi:hypothetical protein [Haloplanus salinarum]|uniref:hypothetical protein n=1 Tax=Haloplanus salinarum TaxID=1912324 RepID=UPI00214C2FC6|nr:hypothetical protein [Haloplanus salinarum]
MSRATDEGPSGERFDDGDCVVCGDPADGIDAARDGNPPVCRRCAKIRLDGDPQLVMGRRSRVEECSCGATVIGYLDGDPCPDCGEVIYS